MTRTLPAVRSTALRLLAVLALVVAVAAPAAGSGWPTAEVAPEQAAGPRVELLSVSPTVLEPTSTLVVRGAVHNDGAQALPAGTVVDLLVQRSQLSTRSSVAAWTDLELDDPVGSLVGRRPLDAELPPGGQVTVEIAVPAADLRLESRASLWGPRGMSLLLREGEGGSRLAVTRSHIVWYPDRDFEAQTRVSVVVPVTAGAPDPATGLIPAERLRRLTATGGPLDAALAAAAVPGVALALDPAVLDPAVLDQGPDEEQADEEQADEERAGGPLASWRARLQEVTAGGETVLLPYGDTDLNAVAHADATELARLAQERGRDVVQRQLSASVRTDVAWPVGGDTDTDALTRLRSLGYTAVVLAEGSHPPVREQRATLTGRGTLDAGNLPMASLLSDTPLSDTLATVGEAADDAGSPVTAVQRLLAETAAVTLEQPSDSRHLLVTAPRGWAPQPQAAVAAVQALTAVPWVTPGTLQTLLDTPAPDVEREPPNLTGDQLARELPAAGLTRVVREVSVLQGLATAVADPAALTAPGQAAAVALAAASWRGDLASWESGIQELAAARAAVQGAVRVVPGSRLTQVSREVELPVTIENTLDQDVSVVLGVESTSRRLLITGDVSVQVPARSSELAQVPVRGVGSGDAAVVAQTRAPGGAPFGEPVTTRVTVRADWETRGTAVVAVVAGLVLAVGLVRTIRRGRRPRGHDPLGSDA